MLLKNKNFQAILVGDILDNPGYSAELEEFIRENDLSGHTSLVGHHSDMPTAFTLADIVISASSLEPEAFGRTTVEAMAMSKPVIATAHGGSLETVIHNENGWLVKPSDPKDLAVAIDRALNLGEEELNRLGQNGKRRVSEQFTAQAMCEKTIAYYYDLIENRPNFS